MGIGPFTGTDWAFDGHLRPATQQAHEIGGAYRVYIGHWHSLLYRCYSNSRKIALLGYQRSKVCFSKCFIVFHFKVFFLR